MALILDTHLEVTGTVGNAEVTYKYPLFSDTSSPQVSCIGNSHYLTIRYGEWDDWDSSNYHTPVQAIANGYGNAGLYISNERGYHQFSTFGCTTYCPIPLECWGEPNIYFCYQSRHCTCSVFEQCYRTCCIRMCVRDGLCECPLTLGFCKHGSQYCNTEGVRGYICKVCLACPTCCYTMYSIGTFGTTSQPSAYCACFCCHNSIYCALYGVFCYMRNGTWIKKVHSMQVAGGGIGCCRTWAYSIPMTCWCLW